MKKEFREALEDSPIIAAIKDDEGLKKGKEISPSNDHRICSCYRIFSHRYYFSSEAFDDGRYHSRRYQIDRWYKL